MGEADKLYVIREIFLKDFCRVEDHDGLRQLLMEYKHLF